MNETNGVCALSCQDFGDNRKMKNNNKKMYIKNKSKIYIRYFFIQALSIYIGG